MTGLDRSMRWTLRIFTTLVLASMLTVTTWASLQCSLFAIPREVGSHPWFIATLFDTYWAFFTFYLWFFYKETGWAQRILGFVALVLLGNIFMSFYLAILAWKMKPTDTMEDLLLRRKGRS